MSKISLFNYKLYALILLVLSICSVIFEVNNLNKFFWISLLILVLFTKYLNLKYKNIISGFISIFAIYIQLKIDFFLLSKDFFINILIILLILKFFELNQKKGHYFFNFISIFLAISSLSFGQNLISSLISSFIIFFAIVHLYLLNQIKIIKINIKNFTKIIFTSLLIVPLIIIFYLIIPRQEISLSLLSSKEKSLGIPDKITLGTFNNISNSDEEVFTYDDNLNIKDKKYFRVKVFDKLDAQKDWLPSINKFLNRNLEISKENLSQIEKNYAGRIILQPHTNTWVPIIKDTKVLSDDILQNDLTSTATSNNKISRKKIFYLENNPKKIILNNELKKIYTNLPNSVSKNLREWAIKEYEISKDDKDYIVKVLKKFSNGNYYYSLTPKDLGNNYSKFFFDTKEGYCEYYAGTFAILTRIVNIPSRIVTGFYGGDYNIYGNFYNIKQSDAHAWVEIWLEDAGWVRIDPTAYIPEENIINSNNLNLTNSNNLDINNITFSKSLKKIFNYIQYLDYKWTSTFTQYDKKSRNLILKKIYNEKNLFMFLKLSSIFIFILFICIIFFLFIFNQKTIFFLLINKLKNKGFKIKNFHTHQEIFNFLDVKEKNQLQHIFKFYEKIKFHRLKNKYIEILNFNILILKYYFFNR